MDQDDVKQFEYVRTTALTEDFRTLQPEPQTQKKPTKDVDCTICLETFDEPRTLPCQHKFCRVCLQYVIDNVPKDPDSDRGFECILCGHFVKVLNYSVPRSQWADNVPDTKLLFARQQAQGSDKAGRQQAQGSDKAGRQQAQGSDKAGRQQAQGSDKAGRQQAQGSDKAGTEQANTDDKGSHENDHCRWTLDWQVSTYPKSYFLENGMDPRRRTKHGFGLKAITEKVGDENDQEQNTETGTLEGDNSDNILDVGDGKGSIKVSTADDDSTRRSARTSSIIAAVFYGDSIVVYDEGMCEVQIYNPDMTLKSSFRQSNIFAMAVLDSDLFMTNPDDRCVEMVDLDNLRKKEPIAITLKCFGISSAGDQLAVLLCDNTDTEFHIGFLNSHGIKGSSISLVNTGENTEFVFPRWLAVCPLTRLAYVSDAKTGLVKCYRLDGRLNWERKAFDAGYLSVYNGYVVVARKFTSSLDVLSGGGAFAGRLESSVYGIEAPKVIAVREDDPEIMVVDKHNMMHVFVIKKETETEVVDTKKCSYCILL